ncbi:MAG: DUF4388 domain-containing protein, partial [Bdellovibrionales bacterium]|nr:DUF4388 domain-containing protein [Bdellovibrionales bacterium]
MQTGKLTEDSFSQLLRSISQKRKQGKLEIIQGEESCFIYFVSGKIVEVRTGTAEAGEDKNESLEVASLLHGAGLINDIPKDNLNYAELFSYIKSSVPASVFQRVIEQRILDKLYSIDLKKGGFFTFNVQMVDVDRDYTPAISVGGFLLDLVTIGELRARISKDIAENKIYRDESVSSGGLSDKEWLIWEYLDNPIDLEELKKTTMLSSFAIYEAVISLFDKGGIAVHRQGSPELKDQLSDVMSIFDKTIDEQFNSGGQEARVKETVADGVSKSSKQTVKQSSEKVDLDDKIVTKKVVSVKNSNKSEANKIYEIESLAGILSVIIL